MRWAAAPARAPDGQGNTSVGKDNGVGRRPQAGQPPHWSRHPRLLRHHGPPGSLCQAVRRI